MTTIVLVRKNNEVVVAGDGQVSMGNTVVKSTASKVRKIEKRDVVCLLYTSPSPRDTDKSRMPSSA